MLSLEPELDVLTEPADLLEFRCCDTNHPRGISHHDAAAAAEFVVISPCCGDRGLLCRSRASYLKNAAAMIHCMSCDRRWPPDRYRFIPLPGALPL